MDPFIGQIILFAGNFPPKGWAFCNGEHLLIADNTGLFSILGTKFGGDGYHTFGLPDLRGRVAVNPGKGPGLTDVKQGERFGSDSTILIPANLPRTSITIPYRIEEDSTDQPEDFISALTTVNRVGKPFVGHNMAKGSIDGASLQPFSNRPPSLGIYYLIALKGVFPSKV